MKWKTSVRWILALALFASVFVLGDVRELVHLRLNWIYVIGILFSTLAFILVHTLRWKKIVNALSQREEVGFLPLYKWMIHSYTLGYIMPKDVSLLSVRTYYLKQHQNLPLSLSLFSVSLDRLLDIVVFLFVILPSLLFVTKILSGGASLLLMVLLLGGLLVLTRWRGKESFGFLVWFYRKIVSLPLIRKRMGGESDRSRWENPSLGDEVFFSVMAWTVWAFLLLVSRFFLTGQSLDVNLSFLQCLFVIPVIQISGIINITPGSLGVLELGSWGALVLVDVPKEQILRFVVGQRVLLTASLLALILLNNLFFLLKDKWHWIVGKDRNGNGNSPG
jgi:uncharacterized membrane protein YbhN (UPF0104 family)